ncbi:Cof-type HAD-IIB family hydrolase [Listeria costaricensis]|uniref:Cof-type HAD-IIB family hydrolase n=1 Tax=Listeria costaricensis TaxID=2026604 RepID=UPI000C07952E|nr:Cof-type HAD-IIB family hydrolase [Listeria costaricensis]
MKKPKLLICDLDGTLLDHTGQVDASSLEEIKAFCASGGELVICTGRLDQDIEFVEEALGFKGAFRISQNGAVIKKRDGEILQALPIASDMIEPINRVVFASGLRVEISSVQNRYFPSPRNPEEVAEFVDTSIVVADLDAASRSEFDPVIYLMFGNREKFAEIKAKLPLGEESPVQATMTSEQSLEIFSKEVSKGRAVKKVMAQMGLSSEQVVIFGDAESDTTMFPLTEYSFAVQDASQEVRSQAKHYAATVGDALRFLKKKELI